MNEHLRQQYGVAVQTSAPVSALHRDPASRRIVAVTARHADRAVEYRARQGVILASGGFSQSPELMSMLAPHLENVLLTGGAGNQGDGLKIAWAHGAAIADIDALVPTFGALQEAVPSEPNTILLAYYRGGIVVNSTGERFVDESKSYKAIGKASMGQAGARGFQIFDQKVMDLSVRAPKTLDFQRAFDLGRVTAADTIVELAERIGIDPQALARTVSEYNDGYASSATASAAGICPTRSARRSPSNIPVTTPTPRFPIWQPRMPASRSTDGCGWSTYGASPSTACTPPARSSAAPTGVAI